MSYDQIFVLFAFFVKDVLIFIWRIIRPNMNNDVARFVFGVGIKLNIRYSVFVPGKNWTFIFLSLESFASLTPAITESSVINLIPFLQSSDCLAGSISDGFDRDALFLASSVFVFANTGWAITISLFSLVAIPCSSLSVLLSASVFCLNFFWSFFLIISLFLCSQF